VRVMRDTQTMKIDWRSAAPVYSKHKKTRSLRQQYNHDAHSWDDDADSFKKDGVSMDWKSAAHIERIGGLLERLLRTAGNKGIAEADLHQMFSSPSPRRIVHELRFGVFSHLALAHLDAFGRRTFYFHFGEQEPNAIDIGLSDLSAHDVRALSEFVASPEMPNAGHIPLENSMRARNKGNARTMLGSEQHAEYASAQACMAVARLQAHDDQPAQPDLEEKKSEQCSAVTTEPSADIKNELVFLLSQQNCRQIQRLNARKSRNVLSNLAELKAVAYYLLKGTISVDGHLLKLNSRRRYARGARLRKSREECVHQLERRLGLLLRTTRSRRFPTNSSSPENWVVTGPCSTR